MAIEWIMAILCSINCIEMAYYGKDPWTWFACAWLVAIIMLQKDSYERRIKKLKLSGLNEVFGNPIKERRKDRGEEGEDEE